jgi:hypothetical protein
MARAQAGFHPLTSFPDLWTTYVSENLFPLFANRVLPQARPEYQEYLEWLSVPATEDDPVLILARSGGKKVTDALEVFPRPERDENGNYHAHFVLHGLSHMPGTTIERASRLAAGERLLVMRDIQNPKDTDALALRTAETYEHDLYVLGYVPRYLRDDILKLMKVGNPPRIIVERINPPPAPVQYRVLCRATMEWPAGFEPLSDPEYEPLVPDAEARRSKLFLAPRHQGH